MIIIKCEYMAKADEYADIYQGFKDMADAGLILLPPGFTLLSEGLMEKGSFGVLIGETKPDPDDPSTAYIETGDGLRLIFRDGKYAGWYTPLLAEVLN